MVPLCRLLLCVLFQRHLMVGRPQLPGGGAGCGQGEAAGGGEGVSGALPV